MPPPGRLGARGAAAALLTALLASLLTGLLLLLTAGSARAAGAAANAGPGLSPGDRARVVALTPVLRRLRACESGGRYATATGNGHYGAYQFSAATWHRLGFRGLPSSARARVQDAAAARLWSLAGAAPRGDVRAVGRPRLTPPLPSPSRTLRSASDRPIEPLEER